MVIEFSVVVGNVNGEDGGVIVVPGVVDVWRSGGGDEYVLLLILSLLMLPTLQFLSICTVSSRKLSVLRSIDAAHCSLSMEPF